MEKLTIHRALSELKTMGERINRGVDALYPSGIVQKDRLVNGNIKREDFEKTAKERFQSVMDLIARRNKIKSAIVRSNGDTKVTIAGKEMTVADAITAKSTAAGQQMLIDIMKTRHKASKAALEKNNANVDANALQIATVALGKEGVKIGEDDVQKVTGGYLAANRFELVDPLNVDEKTIEMETQLEAFLTEVDAVLSESNAVTFIELA